MIGLNLFLVLSLAAVSIAAPTALQEPFPLPATYTAGDTGLTITVLPDGTFQTQTQIKCIKAPCPEAGGQGNWRWDDKRFRLALRQEIEPKWTVEQTWDLSNMSEDVNHSYIPMARVLKSKGMRASEFPVPASVSVWKRVKSA